MKTLLRFILIILLMNACIQSDLSNCPGGDVRFRFMYTLNMANEDRLKDEVQDISMYVFDENDRFVKQIDYKVEESQSTTFRLNQGRYNVLVLGNVNENVVVPVSQSSNLTDLRVCLNCLSGTFQDSIGLFYSLVPNLTVDEYGTSRDVDLRKNSKLINLKLIYDPQTPVDMPSAFLTTNSPAFNYKNELVSEADLKYLPFFSSNKQVPGKEYFEADYKFSTLQLQNDVPLILTASNTGTESDFILNLMEILNKTPIDLVRQDVINISINFTNETSIEIIINEWSVTINNGGIGVE